MNQEQNREHLTVAPSKRPRHLLKKAACVGLSLAVCCAFAPGLALAAESGNGGSTATTMSITAQSQTYTHDDLASALENFSRYDFDSFQTLVTVYQGLSADVVVTDDEQEEFEDDVRYAFEYLFDNLTYYDDDEDTYSVGGLDLFDYANVQNLKTAYTFVEKYSDIKDAVVSDIADMEDVYSDIVSTMDALLTSDAAISEAAETLEENIADISSPGESTYDEDSDINYVTNLIAKLPTNLQSTVLDRVDSSYRALYDQAKAAAEQSKKDEAARLVTRIDSLPAASVDNLKTIKEVFSDFDYFCDNVDSDEVLTLISKDRIIKLADTYGAALDALEQNKSAVASSLAARILALPEASTLTDLKAQAALVEQYEAIEDDYEVYSGGYFDLGDYFNDSDLANKQHDGVYIDDVLGTAAVKKLSAYENKIPILAKLEASSFIKAVNDLPDLEDLTLNDKAAVENAASQYDALSDAAKEWLLENKSYLETLYAAKDKIADLEAAQQAANQQQANQQKSTAKVATTFTVNAKTVTAKALKAAAKKAGATTKSAKSITLGKKVKKVKKGAFKAFKKLKTVTVKTKKLSKKSVKGSLKGSKVKTVKVKVAKAKKANKKYVKKYKKFFAKKNSGKKVKVK